MNTASEGVHRETAGMEREAGNQKGTLICTAGVPTGVFAKAEMSAPCVFAILIVCIYGKPCDNVSHIFRVCTNQLR